jgi:voltage-gated sodium channel
MLQIGLRPFLQAYEMTVPPHVISFCKRVSENSAFQTTIMAVIVVTAILMGIETNQALVDQNKVLFHTLNGIIQTIFVAEITIRLLATAPRMWRFFGNGWNVFDFTVVLLSLLPAAGPFAMVARLARLLRVARLLSVIPELRLLVATMLRSIPSMASIFVLLGVVLYIYAVSGVHLFREVDPDRWGSLGASLLTLFQILTLDSWMIVMMEAQAASPYAWMYFVSFIVFAVFVVVNLFIAVVINNLDAAKEAHKRATEDQKAHRTLIREMRERLEQLERQLEG